MIRQIWSADWVGLPRTVILAAAAALMLNACGEHEQNAEIDLEPSEPAQIHDLAIVGVNVIDVESGAVRERQSIFIDGDTVADIRPTTDDDGALAREVMDREGAYAMPGLWDMHIHLRGEGLENENAVLLRQYVGYGVTGVRDAAGDLPEAVLDWKAAIERGDIVGPRVFTGLQKIDGAEPAWEGSIIVEDEKSAEAALDKLVSDGADYIKIYGSITPDGYLAALNAAEVRNMATSAHMIFTVSFEDTINAGLDNIEHAMYLHKAASPEDAELAEAMKAAAESGDFSSIGNPFARLIASHDDGQLRSMLQLMKARDAAVTPTLYIDHLLSFLDENDHLGDPVLENMPARIVETYQRRVNRAAARPPEQISFDHERMMATMSLMPMVEEEGVMILAGSDAGYANSYVYPGDSVHQEMRMLVEAGVSEAEALRSATINGAKWLGAADRYGSIEPGKAADILILDGNPLENINNTRAIAGLLRNGVFWDIEALIPLRALCHPQDVVIVDCE